MYVKRKLNIGDLMPVVKIVGEIGIKDFKKCFTDIDTSNFLEDGPETVKVSEDEKRDGLFEKVGISVAFDAVDILLTNIPKCERELYTFMTSMCCVTEDEFKEYPLSAFVDILVEIFETEEAKDFFTRVAGLVNLELSGSGTSSTRDTQIPEN